ncbi:MAG: GatB/YqeY domain-containing protein [Candidatus Shapirobacteria bacterium]
MLKRKLFYGGSDAVKEQKNLENMWRDKIKKEAVDALKSGDRKKVEVLRFLVSLIDKREMQLPLNALTEAEEINVLRRELKNKEEAREMFLKAGRNDLVEEQDYEISVVKVYLPKELDEKEIREIVEKIISEKGKNFGAVMGETMKRVAGKADGNAVSKIVKEEMEK